MNPICDVCGASGRTEVRSSGLGAVSFAYCTRCQKDGLEPYQALLATIFSNGWHGLRPGAMEIILKSLEALGVTREDLDRDVSNTVVPNRERRPDGIHRTAVFVPGTDGDH